MGNTATDNGATPEFSIRLADLKRVLLSAKLMNTPLQPKGNKGNSQESLIGSSIEKRIKNGIQEAQVAYHPKRSAGGPSGPPFPGERTKIIDSR